MDNKLTNTTSGLHNENTSQGDLGKENTALQSGNKTILIQLFYAAAGMIGLLFLGLFISVLIQEVTPISVFFGIISILCFVFTYHIEKTKSSGFLYQNTFMLYLGGFFYGVLSYCLFFEMNSDLDLWCFPTLVLSVLTWILIQSRMALYFSLFCFYLAVFFLLAFHKQFFFVVLFLITLVSMVFLLSFYTKTIYLHMGKLQEYFSIVYSTSLYFALLSSFVLSVDSFEINFILTPWLNYLMIGFYIVVNLLCLSKIYQYMEKPSIVFFVYFAILTSGLIFGLNHYGFYNFSICYLFILCSYHLKFKTQWILCSIAMAVNLGIYYYNLDITLLQKSVLLMICGALMLGCYIVFKKHNTKRI